MSRDLSELESKLLRDGEALSNLVQSQGWLEVVAPYLQSERMEIIEAIIKGDTTPKAGRAKIELLDKLTQFLFVRIRGSQELSNQLAQERTDDIPNPEALSRRGRMDELKKVLQHEGDLA